MKFVDTRRDNTLFYLAIPRGEPLEARLPAMRQAIAAGADLNVPGGMTNPGTGRLLHYAICDIAGVDYRDLRQNMPMVELLLEGGADPRLHAWHGESPIDILESWLASYDQDHTKWNVEELELHPFFQAAFEAMKKRAHELDGKFFLSVDAHY